MKNIIKLIVWLIILSAILIFYGCSPITKTVDETVSISTIYYKPEPIEFKSSVKWLDSTKWIVDTVINKDTIKIEYTKEKIKFIYKPTEKIVKETLKTIKVITKPKEEKGFFYYFYSAGFFVLLLLLVLIYVARR